MQWITHLEGGPRRVNHAAVAVGHKIYTFGGYCTGENSRKYSSMDVHVLNTTTFRWTKHPVSDLPYFENDDILPYKRYGHTAVLYKEKIYIWGGRNDAASCSVLFQFDPVWHCWTAPRTTGDLPPARDGHSACVWKNRMYIFGGYEDGIDAFARTTYMLDLEKMVWTGIYVKGVEPSNRDFHSAVCINDKMYVFGGRGTEMDGFSSNIVVDVYCNDIWYLDLRTHEWVKPVVPGQKAIGRRSHSAFVYNNKMYIFGGYNAVELVHFNDLHEFDPSTNTWREIKAHGQPPCSRRRQACVLVENRLFLFGGTSPICTVRFDEDELIDHSDMHVLDMNPSLKTLCFLALKRYDLDDSLLPQHVRVEYANMFTPNKITISRPNNSAG
ncbi:kelch domain-containing protein 3 [Onthophagus taurus]|uniref:kelch domain-containing protein 3 n=1 Tax=Onthophagus taurus TaxID=166361 RepID=UPI0039BE8C1E